MILLIGLCMAFTLSTASMNAQSAKDTSSKAPSGFTWKHFPEIKAAFLMPNGWYFKQDSGDGKNAYFITLEDIDKQGAFLTGLSVNTVPNISKRTGQWAKKYAWSLHQQIKKDTGVTIQEEWENPLPPFIVYGMRCEKKVNHSTTIVMHQLVIANEKTDRLYIVLFESPKNFWDAAWRIGDVMMTQFVLDESV